MPERILTYTEGDLTYEVRVFEEDGQIKAEITVLEGEMDVNAVYFSSAGYDGPSTNLGGPLNMNGGGSQFEGERISWENAVAVSRPGLGREGQNKESFLSEGESLIIDLDGADSIDDVDLIGIRATSVNGGGSIKGVSGNPEIVDPEPEPEPEPDDSFVKLFFVAGTGENEWGTFEFGVSIFAEDNGSSSPNDAFLPEGSDATLDDYLARFLEVADERGEDWNREFDVIRVYQLDENDKLVEVMTLDPGDFFNTDEAPDEVPDCAEFEDDDADECLDG